MRRQAFAAAIMLFGATTRAASIYDSGPPTFGTSSAAVGGSIADNVTTAGHFVLRSTETSGGSRSRARTNRPPRSDRLGGLLGQQWCAWVCPGFWHCGVDRDAGVPVRLYRRLRLLSGRPGRVLHSRHNSGSGILLPGGSMTRPIPRASRAGGPVACKPPPIISRKEVGTTGWTAHTNNAVSFQLLDTAFVPLSMLSVPEPASVVMLSLGLTAAAAAACGGAGSGRRVVNSGPGPGTDRRDR